VRFTPTICAMCKQSMLIRLDNVPFCIECEKKMLETVEKSNPKIKGKLKLVSEQVTK
jgi:hypothetical protein